MKEFIQSHIRHGLTFLAGGITFLQSKGLLSTEEASEASAKFEGAADLLAPMIAVVIARVVISLLGRIPMDKLGGLFGRFSVLCVCGLSTALACGGLVSCSVLEGVDVDGKVYYRHESGAKGGIALVEGEKPGLWFRLPTLNVGDDDGTGLQVEVDANSAK